MNRIKISRLFFHLRNLQLKPGTGERRAIEGCFKPGWVEWFGETTPDSGFLFGIRLDVRIFYLYSNTQYTISDDSIYWIIWGSCRDREGTMFS